MKKAAQKTTAQTGEATARLMELMLSPFDELVEADLIHGEIRNLKHTEGKYFVPLAECAVDDMLRYSAEHMIHPDDQEAYIAFNDPATFSQRFAASETPGMLRAQFRYRLLSGGWRRVEQVNICGPEFALPEGISYAFIYDMEERERWRDADERRRKAASHERHALTGLFWEEAFSAQAREILEQQSEGWCIIAIDIEHFKLFNEWYGRTQGDLLLAQVGAVLRETAEKEAGLACYRGQDDFALLVPNDRAAIEALYEKLHELVRSRGTSVGFLPAFGVTPVDGDATLEELYDRASLASHQAKESYHTRICTFDPAMYEQTEKDYQILSDFQSGLENHELTFYLQPQCLISTGRVVGAESLVRWKKADGTMVSPGVFVPVLEEYGFVTEMDQYVWEAVCAWQRHWIDGGHTPLPISVNVSQIDIFTVDVPDYFKHLLEKYALPVDVLKVEITESAYAENEKVSEAVRRLRDMGLLVLMDDFGSGYSSLNMLRNLTVDIIKLDAQFLRLHGEDRRKGLQIMESIVSMARAMSVPTIVEGVETKEESDFLAGLGCRYAQGFFFYRPMPVDDFEQLILDPHNIDTRGFRFKAKEQFHTRDFLDPDVFTDTVLNNVLGPVGFYALHGESVDVVRYNRQFYEETGGERNQGLGKAFEQRVVPEDRPRLYEMLAAAIREPLDGAEGVLRVRQEDGSTRQFRIHFFFMEEDEGGKKFYGSVQDLTRFITLGDHMRLLSMVSPDSIIFMRSLRGKWSFQVVVHGLEGVLRMTREQIEKEFAAGTFYERVDGSLREALQQLAANAEMNVDMPVENFSFPFHIKNGDGKRVKLLARFYNIHDRTSGVEYILLFRQEADSEAKKEKK